LFTDDPLADFSNYDFEDMKYLSKLPKCAYCDNPIQEDRAIFLPDCEVWICDRCALELRKDTH